MHLFANWQRELMRIHRTYQIEPIDIVLASGVGLLLLAAIAVFVLRRRGESTEGRERWALLAVESDALAEDLSRVLRKASWDVQRLPPFGSLREFLAGFNPSLLVVDQPRYGAELARLETSEAKVASTPVLYVNATGADHTKAPMRAWLPPKVQPKVVLELAEKLARSRPGLQQLSRMGEVQGPLVQGTLLELLYFQANTQRTGRMEIAYQGLSGWLWIEKGDVRHAMVAGVEGVDALHHMLNLSHGRFAFVADVPPPKTTIRTPTVFLLHEYARQRDELGKMAGN